MEASAKTPLIRFLLLRTSGDFLFWALLRYLLGIFLKKCFLGFLSKSKIRLCGVFICFHVLFTFQE